MQKYYSKMFLFASFFITVTTLFSCADKNDNKKENSKTEVVANSVNKQNDNSKQISPSPQEIQSEHAKKNTEEEVILTKTTSLKDNPNHSVSSPAKENLIKSAKLKVNKNIQAEKVNNEKNSAAKVTSKTTHAAEIPSQINAEFPGGIEQFHNFFMKEYKKPESASYWKINLNLAFAVEKNGTVSFLECSPAVEETVEKEMIRVLNLCPKWKPGEFNGKKIKMQYSVPLFLK
ncbi:hypothetical protein [Flavobacterium limi]|uniref:TonB protein C-terminal n=1 Tax=Flavobacterium limi TaxID=2045105 RepID=A0ABQ1TPB0_9FLAO|nr:hypothetical protein [Flavobacterium limi]GGE98769.1 hypothetical protein GCM10011518_05200 [Flavobacterium limi]